MCMNRKKRWIDQFYLEFDYLRQWTVAQNPELDNDDNDNVVGDHDDD